MRERLSRPRVAVFIDGWCWQEKRTDVWLASEMVAQAHLNTYDVAILVTADTDLVPAVEHVRMVDKGVELVVFPRCRTNVSELVKCCTSTTTARRSFFLPYQESNSPAGLAHSSP